MDLKHPGSRGNYRMLETPQDEPIVQIQRVDHESRVHIDIETDDIPAEVMRLEKLGAKVVERLERWVVMQAPTGQRFCIVRVQRPGSRRTPIAGTELAPSPLAAARRAAAGRGTGRSGTRLAVTAPQESTAAPMFGEAGIRYL